MKNDNLVLPIHKRGKHLIYSDEENNGDWANRHFSSLFDSGISDRRITIATNYLALGQWELARSLILSMFRGPSEPEQAATLTADSSSNLLLFHRSQSSICVQCQCLKLLRSIVLIGPPCQWICSSSVPSSSHLSLLCMKLHDELATEICKTALVLHRKQSGFTPNNQYENIDESELYATAQTSLPTYNTDFFLTTKDIFSPLSIPLWCRIRLQFDVLLAQALFDSSEPLPTTAGGPNPVEPFLAKSAAEVRLLFCGLLAIGNSRYCLPSDYESLRQEDASSAHAVYVPLSPNKDTFSLENMGKQSLGNESRSTLFSINKAKFLKCPNVSSSEFVLPLFPSIGFIPSLSLLPAGYPYLPPSLARLPSKVINISNLPFLHKQDLRPPNIVSDISHHLIMSEACETDLSSLVKTRPLLGLTVCSFLRVATMFALAEITPVQLASYLNIQLHTNNNNTHQLTTDIEMQQFKPRSLYEALEADVNDGDILTKEISSLIRQLVQIELTVVNLNMQQTFEPTVYLTIANTLHDFWALMKREQEDDLRNYCQKQKVEDNAKGLDEKNGVMGLVHQAMKCFTDQISKLNIETEVDEIERQGKSNETTITTTSASTGKGGILANLVRIRGTREKEESKDKTDEQAPELKPCRNVVDPTMQFIRVALSVGISAVDSSVTPNDIFNALNFKGTSETLKLINAVSIDTSSSFGRDLQVEGNPKTANSIKTEFFNYLIDSLSQFFLSQQQFGLADDFSVESIQNVLLPNSHRINPQPNKLNESSKAETEMFTWQCDSRMNRHTPASKAQPFRSFKPTKYLLVQPANDAKPIRSLRLSEQRACQSINECQEKRQSQEILVQLRLQRSYQLWEALLGYSLDPSSLDSFHPSFTNSTVDLLKFISDLQNRWIGIKGLKASFAELFQLPTVEISKKGNSIVSGDNESPFNLSDCYPIVTVENLDQFWSSQVLTRSTDHWVSTLLKSIINLWSTPPCLLLPDQRSEQYISLEESIMRLEVMQKILNPFYRLIAIEKLWPFYREVTAAADAGDLLLEEAVERLSTICSTARSAADLSLKIMQSKRLDQYSRHLSISQIDDLYPDVLTRILSEKLNDHSLLNSLSTLPPCVLANLSKVDLLTWSSGNALTTRHQDVWFARRSRDIVISFVILRDLYDALRRVIKSSGIKRINEFHTSDLLDIGSTSSTINQEMRSSIQKLSELLNDFTNHLLPQILSRATTSILLARVLQLILLKSDTLDLTHDHTTFPSRFIVPHSAVFVVLEFVRNWLRTLLAVDLQSPSVAEFVRRLNSVVTQWIENAALAASEIEAMKTRLNILIDTDIPIINNPPNRFAPLTSHFRQSSSGNHPTFMVSCFATPPSIFASYSLFIEKVVAIFCYYAHRALRLDDTSSARLVLNRRPQDTLSSIMELTLEQHIFYSNQMLHFNDQPFDLTEFLSSCNRYHQTQMLGLHQIMSNTSVSFPTNFDTLLEISNSIDIGVAATVSSADRIRIFDEAIKKIQSTQTLRPFHSSFKTFVSSFLERLNVALNVLSEPSQSLIDPLLSADLLDASTSAASTEAAILKSHLERLQESRRAVEVFAELTDSLEGHGVVSLSVTMLAERLQIISLMLSPDTQTQPSYCSRFTDYLLRLVKCIIKANEDKTNSNSCILTKSPKEWITELLFVSNGWSEANDYATAIGLDLFEVIVSSSQPLEYNMKSYHNPNTLITDNKLLIPNLEFLKYMERMERDHHVFDFALNRSGNGSAFLTLLVYLEREGRVALPEKLAAASQLSEDFAIIHRWITMMLKQITSEIQYVPLQEDSRLLMEERSLTDKQESWKANEPDRDAAPNGTAFQLRSDYLQCGIKMTKHGFKYDGKTNLGQNDKSEMVSCPDATGAPFPSELRDEFIETEKLKQLLINIDVSDLNNMDRHFDFNKEELRSEDISHASLLYCVLRWMSPKKEAIEKGTWSCQLVLLWYILRLPDLARLRFLLFASRNESVDPELLYRLTLLHQATIRDEALTIENPSLSTEIGRMLLCKKLQRSSTDFDLNEIVMGCIEAGNERVIPELEMVANSEMVLSAFQSCLQTLLTCDLQDPWPHPRLFRFMSQLRSLDAASTNIYWSAISLNVLLRIIQIFHVEHPTCIPSIEWGIHPCLRRSFPQSRDLVIPRQNDESVREVSRPSLSYWQTYSRHILQLSIQSFKNGKIFSPTFVKALRILALVLTDLLLNPMPLTLNIPERFCNFSQPVGPLSEAEYFVSVKRIALGIVEARLNSGHIQQARTMRNVIQFILEDRATVPSSPVVRIPNTKGRRRLNQLRDLRQSRQQSPVLSQRVAVHKPREEMESIAHFTEPEEDRTSLGSLTVALASHLARSGQLSSAAKVAGLGPVEVNIKCSEAKAPCREVNNHLRISLREFYSYRSFIVTREKTQSQSTSKTVADKLEVFGNRGIDSVRQVLEDAGVSVDRKLKGNHLGRKVAESIEAAGRAPDIERLREFLEWSTIERLKRRQDEPVMESNAKPFLFTAENLAWSRCLSDLNAFAKLLKTFGKDEPSRTISRSPGSEIYPETPNDALEFLVYPRRLEGSQIRSRRLPVMLEVVDSFGVHPQEQLSLLLARRHYRQALELALTGSSLSRDSPPFCDDVILEHLTAIGDLIRPFTFEIINLMAERKQLSELSILEKQLNTISEFLMSRRLLALQLEFFSLTQNHLEAAAVATELSVATEKWDVRVGLLRRAGDHFASLIATLPDRPHVLRTFDRLGSKPTPSTAAQQRQESTSSPPIADRTLARSLQQQDSDISKESIPDLRTPLLDLDPSSLITSQVLFNIKPSTNHRRLIAHATPAQIQKASSLVALELNVLEELTHIPKHYTLLLSGLSSLRIRIAESLLNHGALRLVDCVANQFDLPFVEIGVNCLIDIARHDDELLSEVGMSQQFARFHSIAEFLHRKMNSESFNLMVNSVVDIWESIREAEGERRPELKQQIECLRSLAAVCENHLEMA